MDVIPEFLSSLKPLPDTDLCDRLNYYHSTVIFTVFALITSSLSLITIPIKCWFPAYYLPRWIEYALDHCFVQNTYFIPITEKPAKDYWQLANNFIDIQNITARKEQLLAYYQWVPFMLMLQAVGFYVPVVIWRNLYEASGIKVKAICETARDSENLATATRRNNVKVIAAFMDQTMTVAEKLQEGQRFITGRFVSALLLVVKLLYLLNCVAQFMMLQQFLGLPNCWWGAEILHALVRGKAWPETGRFPRVTLCDFEIRVLGNLHRHTVQCVLMVNMYNEKIFIFLYWWLIIVGALNFCSFLLCLSNFVRPRAGQRLIANYLAVIEPNIQTSIKGQRRRLAHKFIQECLKPDGVLLLRLIATNASDLICKDLLTALWCRYKEKEKFENTREWIKKQNLAIGSYKDTQ